MKKMCFVALAVAVPVLLVLAVSPKVRSLVQVKLNRASTWANKQVAPETKIEALRLRLQELAREDERHYDLVARQELELSKRKKALVQARANLQQEETRLRAMKTALDTTEAAQVSYNGNSYDKEDFRHQFRVDFRSFETSEKALKARERSVQVLEKTAAANRGKLRELERARTEMQGRLDDLERQLAEERLARTRQQAVLDDSSYERLNKDIDELSDEVEVQKRTRELRGQPGRSSVKTRDDEKARQAEVDRAIEARFGRPVAPVASGR